jgi:hypothetical protein
MVIPNVPFTLPLKSPLRVKFPVSVVCPSIKHEPVEVKLKFEMLTEPPLVSVSVVLKA